MISVDTSIIYNFDAESGANGLRLLFGLPNVQLSNPPYSAILEGNQSAYRPIKNPD
jgi:hypothetical protein